MNERIRLSLKEAREQIDILQRALEKGDDVCFGYLRVHARSLLNVVEDELERRGEQHVCKFADQGECGLDDLCRSELERRGRSNVA